MWWVLLPVLLISCAGQPRQYIRPAGVTEEVAKRDAYECRIQATQATQSLLANPRLHPFVMMAIQEYERAKLEHECMLSKGYQFEREEESPQ